MGILVWLIVGGVVGWLASISCAPTRSRASCSTSSSVSSARCSPGFVVSPMLGIGTINQGRSCDVPGLAGRRRHPAGIVNLFRRGRVR